MAIALIFDCKNINMIFILANNGGPDKRHLILVFTVSQSTCTCLPVTGMKSERRL